MTFCELLPSKDDGLLAGRMLFTAGSRGQGRFLVHVILILF